MKFALARCSLILFEKDKLVISGLTSDVTGDQGKARRSCETPLVVRVDGPVMQHDSPHQNWACALIANESLRDWHMTHGFPLESDLNSYSTPSGMRALIVST